MGLTEKGYVRATYAEILESKIQKAKELFGEDIDTSETTPLGKYIRINAYDQALAEEEIEQVYYSRFPNTATGISLDRLCVFVGLTRNPATAARYTVEVKGVAGKTVPMGFLVGTETNINFYNLNDEVIGDDGTVEITVDCTEVGEIGNVGYSAITQIINPSADITEIKGKAVVAIGQEKESDMSLRKRFEFAREGLGSCNENAIIASLLRVSTVNSVGVLVNDTLEDDPETGVPAKSFECYIQGGHNYEQQIGQMIFEKKPIGVKTHGERSVFVEDSGGHEHEIKFSYTKNVNISVEVTIKKNALYETTGDDDIANNITEYINGLGIGVDVIPNTIFGQIYSVPGVAEVTNLVIKKGGSVVSGNIAISDKEIANCESVIVSEAI